MLIFGCTLLIHSIKLATVKRVISPEDWKNRQLNTLKAVGRQNYLQGISSPKADPIARGIATEEKYAIETRKAIDEGRRKAALQKTDMNEWARYSKEIGADNLVDGVVKREAKVTEFTTKFQPMLASHLGKIDTLPEATDSDRENRMLENLRGLKALKGKA